MISNKRFDSRAGFKKYLKYNILAKIHAVSSLAGSGVSIEQGWPDLVYECAGGTVTSGPNKSMLMTMSSTTARENRCG